MTKIRKFIFILTACVMLSVQVYPQQSKSAAATGKRRKQEDIRKSAEEND
jgi:hypothetical protein